jgi:predicted DCC family thiol-disulfide oxidoreductase YuxK
MEQANQGWFLYDGSCGFCATWVPRFASLIRRAGYRIAPLQAEWVKERLGLTAEEINENVRILQVDGTQVIGADVYLAVMKKIWWSRPLAKILSLPGAHDGFEKFYAWFKRHRFAISNACNLPPDDTKSF